MFYKFGKTFLKFLQRKVSQMTDSSLLTVKSEIEDLKSQITKSLNRASKNSVFTNEDMDDMADYFGKKLEECQKQVRCNKDLHVL